MFYAIYILAVLLDLWTTHRALSRHSNAIETHPILSKLFGKRPTTVQLLSYAAVQTSAFIALFHFAQLDLRFMLGLGALHLFAAYRNYSNEKKQ